MFHIARENLFSEALCLYHTVFFEKTIFLSFAFCMPVVVANIILINILIVFGSGRAYFADSVSLLAFPTLYGFVFSPS